MPNLDEDDRLARIARALRRKAGLTQQKLVTADRTLYFVRTLETGAAGNLRLDELRNHFARLDARARLTVWWKGADLDRLLDERHAEVVEAGAAVVRSYG